MYLLFHIGNISRLINLKPVIFQSYSEVSITSEEKAGEYN